VILVLALSAQVRAQNFADATLELSLTLTDVTITDTLTGSTGSAIFETSSEPGDLIFEDIGPNGFAVSGGSQANPPGSIGSAS